MKLKDSQVEYKMFSAKIEESDDKGNFVAMLSTSGNVDPYLDRFLPGAWAKTLKERKERVPTLWVHEQKNPVGSATGGDIPEGLRMFGRLNLRKMDNGNAIIPEAFKAQALYKDYGDGPDLKGMSVGFQTVRGKVDWTTEKINGETFEIRNIVEARLVEISFAPIQANPLAVMTTMKSIDNFTAFLLEHRDDEDLKHKIFSLYGYQPQDLPTPRATEPGKASTGVIVEPGISIYQQLYEEFNRRT